MAKSYLDKDGLLYYLKKIGSHFSQFNVRIKDRKSVV